MAFKIPLKVEITGPDSANMDRIAAQIQAKLGNIKTGVAVELGPNSVASLNQLNATLQQLNGTLQGNTRNVQSLGDASTQTASRIQTLVNANNNLQQSFSRTTGSIRELNDLTFHTSRQFGDFGEQIGYVIRRFSAYTIAASALLGTMYSIKQGVADAAHFQTEMVRLAQVGGDTAGEIRGVATEITRLSQSYGVSSRDLAQASVTIRQAGFTATETSRALQTLAQAGTSANFDSIAKNAEAAIAVMNQFRIGVGGLNTAFSSINAVAAEFAVSAKDIQDAVTRAGGVFAAQGGNLNEFIALFTSVRHITQESSESIATGLRNIFSKLQNRTTLDALSEMRIQLRYTADEARRLGNINLTNQFVGPYEAIQRISRALKDLPATDARFERIVEAIGGTRQIGRALPLIQQGDVQQRALNIAQGGGSSLARSSEIGLEALERRTTQTMERFQEFYRVVFNSDGFQTLAKGLLGVADVLATILKYLGPAVPLLVTLSGIKIAQNFATLSSSIIARATGEKFRTFAKGGYAEGGPSLLTPGEVVVGPTQASNVGYGNLRRFNQGGSWVVPGVGNQDSEMHYLDKGSFVIRKDSVQKAGMGNLMKYASGSNEPLRGVEGNNLIRGSYSNSISNIMKELNDLGFSGSLFGHNLADSPELRSFGVNDPSTFRLRMDKINALINQASLFSNQIGFNKAFDSLSVKKAELSSLLQQVSDFHSAPFMDVKTIGGKNSSLDIMQSVLNLGEQGLGRKDVIGRLQSDYGIAASTAGRYFRQANKIPKANLLDEDWSINPDLFAGGGSSSGIPALLTPGEVVIGPQVVARHGVAAWDTVNKTGRLDHMARGGLVGQYAFGDIALDLQKAKKGQFNITPGLLEEAFQQFSEKSGIDLSTLVNSVSVVDKLKPRRGGANKPVGRFTGFDDGSGGIELSASSIKSRDQLFSVLAHELGHAVDFGAGGDDLLSDTDPRLSGLLTQFRKFRPSSGHRSYPATSYKHQVPEVFADLFRHQLGFTDRFKGQDPEFQGLLGQVNDIVSQKAPTLSFGGFSYFNRKAQENTAINDASRPESVGEPDLGYAGYKLGSLPTDDIGALKAQREAARAEGDSSASEQLRKKIYNKERTKYYSDPITDPTKLLGYDKQGALVHLPGSVIVNGGFTNRPAGPKQIGYGNLPASSFAMGVIPPVGGGSYYEPPIPPVGYGGFSNYLPPNQPPQNGLIPPNFKGKIEVNEVNYAQLRQSLEGLIRKQIDNEYGSLEASKRDRLVTARITEVKGSIAALIEKRLAFEQNQEALKPLEAKVGSGTRLSAEERAELIARQSAQVKGLEDIQGLEGRVGAFYSKGEVTQLGGRGSNAGFLGKLFGKGTGIENLASRLQFAGIAATIAGSTISQQVLNNVGTPDDIVRANGSGSGGYLFGKGLSSALTYGTAGALAGSTLGSFVAPGLGSVAGGIIGGAIGTVGGAIGGVTEGSKELSISGFAFTVEKTTQSLNAFVASIDKVTNRLDEGQINRVLDLARVGTEAASTKFVQEKEGFGTVASNFAVAASTLGLGGPVYDTLFGSGTAFSRGNDASSTRAYSNARVGAALSNYLPFEGEPYRANLYRNETVEQRDVRLGGINRQNPQFAQTINRSLESFIGNELGRNGGATTEQLRQSVLSSRFSQTNSRTGFSELQLLANQNGFTGLGAAERFGASEIFSNTIVAQRRDSVLRGVSDETSPFLYGLHRFTDSLFQAAEASTNFVQNISSAANLISGGNSLSRYRSSADALSRPLDTAGYRSAVAESLGHLPSSIGQTALTLGRLGSVGPDVLTDYFRNNPEIGAAGATDLEERLRNRVTPGGNGSSLENTVIREVSRRFGSATDGNRNVFGTNPEERNKVFQDILSRYSQPYIELAKQEERIINNRIAIQQQILNLLLKRADLEEKLSDTESQNSRFTARQTSSRLTGNESSYLNFFTEEQANAGFNTRINSLGRGLGIGSNTSIAGISNLAQDLATRISSPDVDRRSSEYTQLEQSFSRVRSILEAYSNSLQRVTAYTEEQLRLVAADRSNRIDAQRRIITGSDEDRTQLAIGQSLYQYVNGAGNFQNRSEAFRGLGISGQQAYLGYTDTFRNVRRSDGFTLGDEANRLVQSTIGDGIVEALDSEQRALEEHRNSFVEASQAATQALIELNNNLTNDTRNQSLENNTRELADLRLAMVALNSSIETTVNRPPTENPNANVVPVGFRRSENGLLDRVRDPVAAGTLDGYFSSLGNVFTGETFRALFGQSPVLRAGGGSIFQSRGTDTVPAMLTPGEFVVNRASSEANRALLENVNAARGPLYRADGGGIFSINILDRNQGSILGAGAISAVNRLQEDDIVNRQIERDGVLNNNVPPLHDAHVREQETANQREQAQRDLADGRIRGLLNNLAATSPFSPIGVQAGINNGGGLGGALAYQAGASNNLLRQQLLSQGPTSNTFSGIGSFSQAGQTERSEQAGVLATQARQMRSYLSSQPFASTQNQIGRYLSPRDRGITQTDAQRRAIEQRDRDEVIAAATAANRRRDFIDQAREEAVDAARLRHARAGGEWDDFDPSTVDVERYLLNRSPRNRRDRIVGDTLIRRAGYASGGMVSGPEGLDVIPAMLSRGEYVMDRNTVSRVGAQNLANMQRFAAGGSVGGDFGGESTRALAEFSNNSNALVEALTNFSNNNRELVEALKAFPHTVQMEAKHQVDVVINGGQAIADLQDSFKEMVQSQIKESIDNFVKDKLPDLS